MINLQAISLQRGSKFLLEHADLTIHPGQHVGLIGANGSGKSSLFQLLLGQLQADSGDCLIPAQWRVAHMAQEVHEVARSALDHVLDGDEELRRVENAITEEEQRHDHCGETLASLFAEMETIDGYTAQSRAQQLLNGLGFKPGDDQRPVSDFSGGWRIRLNLAQALMCPSDLLLLDEPTNHLDLDATLWLEQWLGRYRGTLLIISHDRDFLDNVVDRIVSYEGQKLIGYQGNYSSFEKQRAERLAQQQQAFEKQQQRIGEIENFVRRFRAQATKAKQAQSRLKELERMEQIAPAHVDSPFHFSIAAADKMSDPLVKLDNMDIGYGDKTILSAVNLNISPSSRLGLLGPNGAGKSSLVKTLAGTLEPLLGERVCGEHLAIGYFAQHQLEALDLKASAALHIQRLSPKASEQEIRNFLGGFGFHGDRAFETIHHFSGGEKARLALALITWQKPNVLLLDEPTNHLDLEMRHALTVALQGFEGAVIVVSHDRHLLRNSVDEFLLIADGKLEHFNGTLEDYYQWMQGYQLRQRQTKAEPQATANPDVTKNVDKKAQRQQLASQRQQLKPLTNRLRKLDTELEKLHVELEGVEQQLGDSQLYEDGNNEQLQALLKSQRDLRQKLDNCEEEWMLISEEIETLKDA